MFVETTGSNLGQAVTAITSTTTEMGSQAIVIIGAAVGLGLIFWGAKLLWTKFKSMAK